jgi:YheC/D like ATP-grasp
MNHIGFHHNYPTHTNLGRRFSPSLINRVVLIDQRLRDAGCRLFLHSPRDILVDRDVGGSRPSVDGCMFENGAFIPTRAPVPAVNGNWTHRTRRLLDQGMGYQEFGSWTARHAVAVYVPHAFSELVGDKLETYRLVRAFRPTLHPHCEPYRGTLAQLRSFVESAPVTFIKPRKGSKGNRIITLRRDDEGLLATRYFRGERRTLRAANARAMMAFIAEVVAGDGTYVLQHGVETMRYERSTFDIRVTMVHDGTSWHWLHEARLSRPDSDVSNVSQGGAITPTEELLFELMGPESSHELLHELECESFGLAAYLERLHPRAILEVAFDFAIDREGRLHLLEINTKPGLAGVGSEISIYQKRPEQEALFERWVYPHTKHLASFLLSKAGLLS